jgi:hypothetical protein
MTHGFSVDVHDRSWFVDESGIATVTVQLSDVTAAANTDIVLATLVPPYCDYRADAQANCDGCMHDVTAIDPNVPGARFEVGSQPVNFMCTVPEGGFKKILWSFSVSCAVPYLAADQGFPPENYWQNDSKRRFLRSYELQIPCEELRISVEFKGDPVFLAAKGIVERRKPQASIRWTFAGSVDVDHDAKPSAKGRTAKWSIKKPTVGHRFGIELTCDASATEPSTALSLADHVREICRNEQPAECGLIRALNESLLVALANQWPEDDPLARSSATGFLWSLPDKVLEAAYGICPIKDFAFRFKFGCGVAGHAFRFARCAGLHLARRQGDESDSTSLLHQKIPGESHDWVVCIPILTSRKGTPVGVVSFSGRADTETKSEADLYSLAKFPKTSASKNLYAALLYSVSAAFWDALKTSSAIGLSTQERVEASKLFDKFSPSHEEEEASGQSDSDQKSASEPLSAPANDVEKVRSHRRPRSKPESSTPATQLSSNSLAPKETVANKAAPAKRTSPWGKKPLKERLAWIAVFGLICPALITGAIQLSTGKSDATSQTSATTQAPAAPLTRPQLVELLRRGADGVRELRVRRDRGETIMSLENEDLIDFQLVGAPLQGLSFRDSLLDGINLNRANLNDADLAGVKLRTGRNGVPATLKGAQLQNANLANAEFDRTDLAGTNLSGARGLDQNQLNHACGDKDTRVPPGLSVPSCN